MPRWVAVVLGVGSGAVLTLPALFLAFVSAGGGHGDYFFARLLFPYAMLDTRMTQDTIGLASLAMAVAQLPIERGVAGVAWGGRGPWVVGAAITGVAVGAHVVAFWMCGSLRYL